MSTMVSACFVTPAPLAVRPGTATLSPSLSKKPCRTPVRHASVACPTMSLRFPGGSNPFSSGSFGSSGIGRFFSFGSGSGMGSGMGSGSGRRNNNGRNSGASSGGGGGGGNIFKQIWAGYNSNLDQFPIMTKAMTSLVGFLLGDVIAQKFLGAKEAPIDWKRAARMAAFGFLIHGPTGHYFYSALDRIIVGTSPIKVASKVVVDQVFWAPIFTAIFFAFLGFAEGKSVDVVKTKIQNDTWTGVTTSWKFWPLAHTINFAFVPTSQRLLYINTLQVGYNVILSILGNK